MAISNNTATPALNSSQSVRDTTRPSFRGFDGSGSILVLDDETGVRNFLQRGLAKHYPLVEVAESVESAISLVERCHFDLIIVDIRLPGRSGLEWMHELRDNGSNADFIVITAYADLDAAIASLRVDASDFILKPFRMEEMVVSVQRCFKKRRLARENLLLPRRVDPNQGVDRMVGESRAIAAIRGFVEQIAPTRSTVLIEGETGTGKELVAQDLHRLSGRTGVFVPVNCGSIAPELLESELFGHAKGAFTSAHQAREGLFVHARSGTVFLDEISEMPLHMQVKLLRVLDDNSIRPVGADREVPIDVRIIAATNCDLLREVHNGKFRDDLFYRLNVLSIKIPPLRERTEDIPTLAHYFVERLSRELGLLPVRLGDAGIVDLQNHLWPGNVRELKNVVERMLHTGRLPAEYLTEQSPQADTLQQSPFLGYPLAWDIAQVEKNHMLRVLDEVNGNKSEAARRLGVSRKTLERKVHAWS